MKSNLGLLDKIAPRPKSGLGIEGRILRLVKGGAERRAIEAGQVDAVIDSATGKAFLLPEAQAALREDEAVVRSLLALSTNWSWEQDEFYRFVSHTGASSGSAGIYDENIIGKMLWDLPIDSMSDLDWRMHRTLLEWRASFRDLELRCIDRAGEMRWVSVSGEPIFDEQNRFTGYRGTMRDVTPRKQAEALAQKPIRLACDTLDSLPYQVCVLDSAGAVIMANKSSRAFAAGIPGLGAGFHEGINFLEMCEQAPGNEREDGAAIAAGIRRVMAGDSPLYHHEYVCDSPAGRCRFRLTVAVFSGDGAARTVVSREDITERNRKGATGGEPIANSLLAALSREDYQHLRVGLEAVTLTCGEVLYEPGDPIRHVYFPNDCLVSLLATVGGCDALEVGLVGREGVVGIAVALGTEFASVRALVQGTGTAMRMESVFFQRELQQCAPLRRELYRYTHAKLVQARQIAACNRFHALEARLVRWLLMTRDRLQSNDFPMTQEFLSHTLGVHRAGVTKAAGRLQKRGLIEYSRGNIRIIDQHGLEAEACSCYQVFRGIPLDIPGGQHASFG